MKKAEVISVVFRIGFVRTLQARFDQPGLFSGFKKRDFALLSSLIHNSTALSVSILAFFQKFRNEERQIFDEVGVHPTLFWNSNEMISIGPSCYDKNFGGFSERLSAKFTPKNSKDVFIVIPTVTYSKKKHASSAALFAQFLAVWDKFKIRSISFQQLRLGLYYKRHPLGLGADFEQYGSKPIQKSPFGCYYRKTL
ncbi:hypothetical protein [Spongiimicrobium salis]|uniref:hypothetical protein n=1 Tax=Spongiimicrobium salis TaxID=1667022 RepID=UPI00374CE58E